MSLQDRVTEESRAAHRRIQAALKGKQAEALAVLQRWGPGTAKEMAAASGADFPNLQKRLSELLDVGFARKVEMRPCGVTGYRAVVWRATDSRTQETAPRVGSGSPTDGGAPAMGRTGATLKDTLKDTHPELSFMPPAIERHSKDPVQGTLYQGKARPVGARCGCGSVSYFCEACGNCNAPGHQLCEHERARRANHVRHH